MTLNKPMPTTQPYVLMLEDDTDDRFLTTSTLLELGINVNINFVQNSEQLFLLLPSAEKPVLILIDYDINPENGVVILKKIKADSLYKSIPVVILGNSSHAKYVSECYANGANSYIKKPTNLEETKTKIGIFFRYWLEVAEIN